MGNPKYIYSFTYHASSDTTIILVNQLKTIIQYSEDCNPCHDLAELQEYFQQFQGWLTQLEPSAKPHAHVEALAQLNDKLQQLNIPYAPHNNKQT